MQTYTHATRGPFPRERRDTRRINNAWQEVHIHTRQVAAIGTLLSYTVLLSVFFFVELFVIIAAVAGGVIKIDYYQWIESAQWKLTVIWER